jgi:hypothetical protein
VARSLTALALAFVLLAGACAEPGPPTLATGSLEGSLSASIWPDDPGLVSDVDCPALDVELIAQTTTCTALLDADPVTVDVQIDELGAATATVREPLFRLADAETELATRLRDDLSLEAIEATCEGTVLVAEPGRAISCEATDGGRPIPMIGGDGLRTAGSVAGYETQERKVRQWP